MFVLIRAWINVWVNNRKAGDLRRYRAHYDVTVVHPRRIIFNFGGIMVARKDKIVYLYHSLLYSLYLAKTTSQWRLKSSASSLYTQPFIQEEIKENIKAPRHWPLCGESTVDRWIPRTKGQ